MPQMMEEPANFGLFEKLCKIFPHMPKHIVQECVNQNPTDEQICIQTLEEISVNSLTNADENYSSSNYHQPVLQLTNMNQPNQFPTVDYKEPHSSNVPPPSLKLNWDVPTTNDSQTAPTSSSNRQGFQFAVLIPYPNNSFYGMDNDVYQPDSLPAKSISPRPKNFTNGEVENSQPSMPSVPFVFAHLNSENINGYVPNGYESVASPPINGNPEQLNSNLPKSPEAVARQFVGVQVDNRARSPFHQQPERSSTPDVNTPLHIQIDNGPTYHEWIPVQQYALSPGYSVPVQLVATQNGVEYPSNFQLRVVSPEYFQNLPRWPQGVQPNQQRKASTIQPSRSDPQVKRHIAMQRQRLNTLKSEFENTKILYANLRRDVAEQQLQETSCQPNEDAITLLKRNIESLRQECSVLCSEVDRYSTDQVPVPLGETAYDFYSCLNTGQQGPPRTDQNVSVEESKKAKSSLRKTKVQADAEEEEDVRRWKCKACTFDNHPDITDCEICTEPRTISIHNDSCGEDSKC